MSSTEHKRSDKVAQLIQHEVGRLLVSDLHDPRVGFVTVTEVRLTDDLRTAQVFVSVFGPKETRHNALEALHDASGFVRRELAHRIKLRYVPSITFRLDETLDQAERLDAVLNAAHDGAAEAPAQSDDSNLRVPVHHARSGMPAHEPQKKRRPRRGQGAGKGRSKGPKRR